MPIPIQTPDPTQAAIETYDLVGGIRLELEETISPVFIVDDGWARVQYLFPTREVPASTAAQLVALHPVTPEFIFKLLQIQYRATGGYAERIDLQLAPAGALVSVWNTLEYDHRTFPGLGGTEEIMSREIIGDFAPWTAPNVLWQVGIPATGVGETFSLRAIVARIPRRMRP